MLHNPLALSLLLLLTTGALTKRKTWRRICFWVAVTILLVCGNGWVVGGLARHLERRYLPPDPLPKADCIVVLSGGVLRQVPPQPTVQITDAGNRVLYAAYLYRQGKAPQIICTGGSGPRGIGVRSAAEDMAEFLEMIGLPKEAITKETKARNTHEHAVNLYPLLREQGFQRVLLVTSAMHMPRSMGVFRRLCPGIEFVAAPTDFRATERIPAPWYQQFTGLIPTPRNLSNWSQVIHEYLGIAYYRLHGWM